MHTTETLLDQGWPAAGPFRALARHLMDAGSVEARDLALLVDLPPATVVHLVHGRAGRPVRRVSPTTADALMSLTAERVRDLRRLRVPPSLVDRKLKLLAAAGWSRDDILRALGGPADRQAVAALTGGPFNRLILLRLRAMCGSIDAHRTDDAAAA